MLSLDSRVQLRYIMMSFMVSWKRRIQVSFLNWLLNDQLKMQKLTDVEVIQEIRDSSPRYHFVVLVPISQMEAFSQAIYQCLNTSEVLFMATCWPGSVNLWRKYDAGAFAFGILPGIPHVGHSYLRTLEAMSGIRYNHVPATSHCLILTANTPE